MLKIILAEDHKLVRDGIKMLLSSDPNLHIVAEAANGQEVLRLLEEGIVCDLILTDINMPEVDGTALLQALKAHHPGIKTVFLSMLDTPKDIAHIMSQGADGYLLKNTGSQELLFALKYVSTGEKYVCAELGLKLLNNVANDDKGADYNNADFSERELEILKLIADGYTNMEMADRLFISKRTIEGHRQSLLEKTGSRNTATLIRAAIMRKLI